MGMLSPNEVLNKSGNMLLDTSMYAQDLSQLQDQNEKNAEVLKAMASHRIKGRLLLALSKNTTNTTRTAFIRWYVRTHRKLGKKYMTSFAIKGKVSVQVAFWRFKFLVGPFMKKKKKYVLYFQELRALLEKIETKQVNNSIRSAFFNIKLMSELQKYMRQAGLIDNLTTIIESQLSYNYLQLKDDTSILNKSTIFQKMIKGIMGKYIESLNKLRGHNLNAKLNERLSEETKQRLMERLCKGAEGSLRGLKRIGYEKMVNNKKLWEKKKGVCRRICDTEYRLMGQGYNKLLEDYKMRMNEVKNKLRFVIKTLTDKDAQFLLLAYNGLKERANVLNGIGLGDAATKKVQLLKRLTSQGYNLQCMAINAYTQWLEIKRQEDMLAELERQRQQKEKDRILMMRQRGIMRRIVDSNVRLMGMGYNKLVEEHKARMNEIKNQLKFIIKSLTDKDAQFLLQAYNGMKQRMMMLNGIGLSDAGQKRLNLIKRLTNKGYDMQVQAINAYINWLKWTREEDRLAALEAERQRKEKDRILRRVMDVNARMQGQAYRQIRVNCEEEAEKERVLMA